MCGIMAYSGKRKAFPILIKGLQQLEYRGYDSAGVAIHSDNVSCYKTKGKVSDLLDFCSSKNTDGNTGIGHTRWATHGVPNDINAHPHQSQSGRFTMVHNGIIENYEALKTMLRAHGYTFQSQTDTEVLVQLIDWYVNRYQISTTTALTRALQDVEGSFAIVLLDLYNPNQLYVSRRQSPLVIGIGENEVYASSDAMTMFEYTKKVIYLEEDIVGLLNANGTMDFCNYYEDVMTQEVTSLKDFNLEFSKGEYESFMLKEINEQPESILRSIRSYFDLDTFTPKFDSKISTLLKDTNRIIITACGTSMHSGMIAEYWLEKYARVNVEVEVASEFRYKDPLITSSDLVIGISQSGETADTLAALEMAKSLGAKTLGLVNGVNSSIARMVDEVIYLNAGPEISVASTKAFTSQLTALYMLALEASKVRQSLSLGQEAEMIRGLIELPQLIKETLKLEQQIADMAHELVDSNSSLFLGRGMLYPLAAEGALKLKEITYIHAEGYAAGEMKHGPIALIDDSLPVIAHLNNDESLAKMISNVQEVKARNARVIVVKNVSTPIPRFLTDHILNVPDVCPSLNPILQIIPMQLLSYYVAKMRGCNVDQPRNLAKSVTVE